jgi:hypothetical protein
MGREIVSFTDAVRIPDYCVTYLGSESICSFGSWDDVFFIARILVLGCCQFNLF